MSRPPLRYFTLLFLCLFVSVGLKAQINAPSQGNRSGLGADIGQNAIHEYEIGGITVSGSQYLDQDLIIAVSGLNQGMKVRLPNDDGISRAIRQLWKQDLFANVSIDITRIAGDKIFLEIVVEERPKLSRFNFKGITKTEANEVKDKIGLNTNRVFT